MEPWSFEEATTMSRTFPGITVRQARYSVPSLAVAMAVRQQGQDSELATRTDGLHVAPPSVERVR